MVYLLKKITGNYSYSSYDDGLRITVGKPEDNLRLLEVIKAFII